jgi:molecular chaperone DnaK (HSP70)
LFNVLIPKGTKLPARANGDYVTIRDNQQSVEFLILEGESKYAKDNIQLDKYELSVKPAPKGTHVIHVTFSLDTYGALNVFMEDTGLKKQHSMRVGSVFYKPMSLEEWESEAKFLRSLFDETNRASVGYFPTSSEEEAGLGDFFFKKKDYTAALEHYEHAKKMEKDARQEAKVDAKVRLLRCTMGVYECGGSFSSHNVCYHQIRESLLQLEEGGHSWRGKDEL